ncbi:peptidylprolyl isomerase [Flavisolibacter ginsenosidimutans]|uniref:Peptidyl-prolyl cis-trans isomerase n=1 Tax=Flavisolibacter ginsenosidimutans TaxID=661481 RepID=A0A5B8ULS2_9BACT|nr:peptidylprolyl isomerase [Flavisolibacter ginsenosidimutans]QEC57523.1 peptidylprolyl isomerase [Flavisolibacter ginsenosidimutans]
MRQLLLPLALCLSFFAFAQQDVKIKNKDRKKDAELVTTEGTIILRLSDSTPEHRDNFLRLVKSHYLDSILFHRVIKGFMIQAGDPTSVRAEAHKPLGNGGPDYTLPAEILPSLFHKKGALAAARKGDAENPERRSSGSQFYIVNGRTFNDHELDSIEVVRLQGRKISPERREYYKTIGGTPQLDGNYTVFGEVVSGQDVVDKIASMPVSSGPDLNRPLQDVRILSAKLVKRKK